MNKRIKELMVIAGYAAPEIATRAQKLADLIVKDIQLSISSGILRGIEAGEISSEIKEVFEEEHPIYTKAAAARFVEKEIAIIRNTTPIDDPEIVYSILASDRDPSYESDGQFSGGLSTVIFEVNDMCYEFIFNKDKIIEATKYPMEYKRYDN